MRYIEMFGGIGGFRHGLEAADGDHECVGYYEIDEHAVASYNAIFRERERPTDIRDVDAGDIPDHDILTAGFPCQSFSIAGDRKGLEDSRGTLFHEIVRIAKEKQPPFLLLENVRGILSHEDGVTFATVIKSLNEIGYYVDFRLLNSKYHGVPQNRNRVIIFGIDLRWAIENSITSAGQTTKKTFLNEIIQSYLLESLLTNSIDQSDQSGVRPEDWGLNYHLLNGLRRSITIDQMTGQKTKFSFLKNTIPTKLIKKSQTKSTEQMALSQLSDTKSDSKNISNRTTKDDTSTVTDTLRCTTDEEISDSIIKWLQSVCLDENSKTTNSSTTSTWIKQITEKKTFTSAEINLIIIGCIIKHKNSWANWFDEASSNLTKMKESTDYATRRETTGAKGRFNLRRDFYSLELEGKQNLELDFGKPLEYSGERPWREILPLRRETGKGSGEDGGEKRIVTNDGVVKNNTNVISSGGNSAMDDSDASFVIQMNQPDEPEPIAVKGDLFSFDDPQRQGGFSDTMFTLRSAVQHGIIQTPRGKNEGGWSGVSPTATSSRFEQNHFIVNHQMRPEDRPSIKDGDEGGSGILFNDEYAYTLDKRQPHYITEGLRIRKLTPLECWRLQGFPDSSFKAAEQVNSDTQLYKQAGNAITTNVVEAVGSNIYNIYHEE